MSSKITIIRHAPTEYNSQNIFMGDLDIPVLKFDETIIKNVKQNLPIENFTSIYSSPLQRAYQTAKKVLGDNCNIIIDNRLKERNLGIWQGINKEEIRKNNKKIFHGDIIDFYYTPEQGETFKSFILRVASFITDNCKNSNNILLFTHNGVFRVIKSLLTGVSLSITFNTKEPFLFPQDFFLEDSVYSKIQNNPFYTLDIKDKEN